MASSLALAQTRGVDERTAVRSVCSRGPATELRGAGHSRIRAAEALASVYDNPRILVEHHRALAGPDDQETIVGVGFSIPVSGRRGLLRQAASERRRQVRAETSAALLETALELRAVYARAVLDAERVTIARVQQAALRALLDQTAALARTGEAAAYDQLRQQAEVDLHAQRLAMAEAAAEHSRATLEVWLGAGAQPGTRAFWDLGGANALRKLVGSPDVKKPASPAVAALEAQARASLLEARSARRRAVPEPDLFGGYRTTSGAGTDTGHGIAVALEVPLPLFDHGQADGARAEAEAASSRALASARRRDDQARVSSALRKLLRLEQLASAANTAAQRGAEIETKAIALYRAGESSVSELLDALRSAEAARLGRMDLAEELVAARLELMRASGRQFDPELDRACDGGSGVR